MLAAPYLTTHNILVAMLSTSVVNNRLPVLEAILVALF